MAECHFRLSAYLDKELPEQELVRIEAHLATCAACRAELGEYDQIRLQIQRETAIASPKWESMGANREISAGRMAQIHLAVERAAEMAKFRNLERIAGMLAGLAACLAVVGVLLTNQASEPVRGGVERAATLPADEDLAAGKDTTSRDASVTAWMVADLSGGGNP